MSRLVSRIVISVAATGGVILVLVLGLGQGPQFFADRVTSPVGPSGEANRLELSVHDQPRDLPEIRFADDQGHELTLADFRGRVLLLNVWATWCVPCRNEMPTLDRLQAKLGGDEFLVIPLSIDREGVAPVKRFYQELGLEKLRIYVDPSGKASRAFAIPGVPTTLLIDRKGREVARKMGAAEWDGPEMVSLVERTMRAPRAGEGNRDR